MERRDRTTHREITIFSEIPGDVTWIFPGSTIFVETKRRAGIEKATNEEKKRYQTLIQEEEQRRGPIKCKEITHCSNGEISHEVHPVSVDCIYCILPFSNRTIMRIQNAEIKWRVTCDGLTRSFSTDGLFERRTVSFPNHVKEHSSRYEDQPNTHAVQIIQSTNETLDITTKAKLGFPIVILIDCLEKVVVGRVSICELVHQDGVRRKSSPILG